MAIITRGLGNVFGLCTKALGSEQRINELMLADRTDAQIPKKFKKRFAISQEHVASMPTTYLRSRGATHNGYLMYLHGGAFVTPIISAHWSVATSLVTQSDWTGCVPSYPLLPQAHADDVISQLCELYRHLLRDRVPVVVAGDSAGAHLAIALAHEIAALQLTPPARLLLYSPWIDTTMENVSPDASVSLGDNVLDRNALAYIGQRWGNAGHADSHIKSCFDSARRADFPPTVIYQGGRDILARDAMRFAVDLRRSGGTCDTLYYRDGFHSFIGTPLLPESRHAIRHSRRLLNDTSQHHAKQHAQTHQLRLS